MISQDEQLKQLAVYRYGFRDEDAKYDFVVPKGLSREVVEAISHYKGEPDWMRKERLQALEIFLRKPLPRWGADLSDINFDEITYYASPTRRKVQSWDDVPEYIKRTYDKLGIPEAERRFLAGLGAQYDSEVVYHKIREDLAKQGVIFVDTDTAVREYPDIVREYFGTVIPAADNKFAALNTAVWSGGSFVYVPPGVRVEMPLQAYFRINAENVGQFERTLIIAEEGSFVHYIEGCTAPIYATDSLHSAVVELIAKKGATIRYTTIQNWSHNVYNLVTKRGVAYEDASIIWVDGNLGSKITMKYPCVYMLGRGARGEVLSVAFASAGQHQDAGAKMIHAAPDTTSIVTSKSISMAGGRASYRGMVKVYPNCKRVKVNVRCDALLLDEESRTDTYPVMEIEEEQVEVAHEATVSKIGEEQLFYLTSRGLSEEEAIKLIVNGFFRDFAKELPMEYAVELNRLIELQLEGSVG
ncbi:MAG: Fe-S cluster assembly protein SufB [Armatimonadetes bacterium]|nr:Fe-S cluster assembly protein SufB [Armatimonadota bacterium]MDW8120815.1 Fe-S cluster assembly protein SufB [Armatimonadota bacterium]